MASRSTTLAIQIVSDASRASAGLQDASGQVDTFSDKMKRAGGLIAGIGLVDLGKQAFEAASDLQQNAGAVDAIFGEYSKNMEAYASKAADSVGLSTSAYDEMAAVLGSQLKNAGFAGDDLTTKVNGLISTGADLAAQFGGSTQDAVEALSSAFKGETDPIERYGVSIKQADINAQLAANGQDKLTGAAAKQATAMAVMQLVTAQTASAQGQFAAQSDTSAERLQVLQAKASDATAQLGTALLPAVSFVADKLADFAGWLSKNTDIVIPLIVILGTLAAVIWAVNFAMDANPFTLVAIAIGVVIAAVVVAYNKFQTFRDIVNAIGSAIATAFNAGREAIGWVVDKIKWVLDKVGAVGSFFGHLFSAPAPAPATVGPAAVGGVYGGPGGGGAPRWAASSGGGSSSVGGSSSAALSMPGTVINLTVNGAVDGVSTGRQIVAALKEYGVATGGQVVVQIGSR